MDNVIEIITVASTLVTLFLIPAILFVTLYLIKRNGFYIRVNCWFCNGWTKVAYADRNSFYCPFCQQYNGFTVDGGYNKVIEEQFDTSFNKTCRNIGNTDPLSNGLCSYCNNNQQLKVRQLAAFVPLDEKNFDIEVEHFRKQLEKSYKLCKKCDKVLKKTLETQHAWIFGNHVKNIQKGLSSINYKKINKLGESPLVINLTRYFLILLSFIILFRALKTELIGAEGTVRQYIPDSFVSYIILLKDWYRIVSNATNNIIENVNSTVNFKLIPGFENVRIIKSYVLAVSWVGLVLDVVLLIWELKSVLWKSNELLSWITLVITSVNVFPGAYVAYINRIQLLCSTAIIYSLSRSKPVARKENRQRKFAFKKLQTNIQREDDLDTDEEISEEIPDLNKSCKNKSQARNFLFQSVVGNTANSNDNFITARSTRSSSVFNSSLQNSSVRSSSGDELHHSLDNLHLGNLSFVSRSSVSPTFSLNSASRPILSPPKLKNITQNSWTAGGFWKNDVPTLPAATNITNLSRSSSQSSGFISCNEPAVHNSFPCSREASVCGDYEKTSIASEPTYHFEPINSSWKRQQSVGFPFNTAQIPKQAPVTGNQLYYKADNVFYPILQNNMLLIQGNDIPRYAFENRFSNLPSWGLNSSNRVGSPAIFGEKPVISSLFKNLDGFSTQSHAFTAPR
ncbi:hypothetical protein NQ315_011942 [Exocentrus adspersus]|uniref:Ima1 N-terminal domain-containing protein n=1 Tax=Exocentrus adspersus TaxID=1586481 RepID=A0AAV8W136_9CUCU|nr:hypothetical protein NQ315_011942 [Exocentrus adspersus]